MANVHNQTAHHLHFTFSTMHGMGAVAVGPHGVGVAVGIMQGVDNAAVIGVGGLGDYYPGLHMGNIYVMLTPDGQVAIHYGP